MIQPMAGITFSLKKDDIVEGKRAQSYVDLGLAVPITERAKPEKATASKGKKEVRSK